MTKQEAYQELRKRIDEHNKLRAEMEKFAAEHGLLMGTLRSDPERVGVTEPKKDPADPEFDSSAGHWDDGDDEFISSQVCW